MHADLESLNLYQILQLTPKADALQVKKAFQKQALLWHPDKNETSEAAARFTLARLAFDILSHPVRRLCYDRNEYTNLEALQSDPIYDEADFLFQRPWISSDRASAESLFARYGAHVGGWGKHTAHAPQNKPPTQETEKLQCLPERTTTLSVALEDLYLGFECSYEAERLVQQSDGKLVREMVVLKVVGQPGWTDGTRVTFAGAGDELADGTSGDYTVVVAQKPHAIFSRHVHDLAVTAKVSLWGALYGATTHIPLVSGSTWPLPLESIVPGYTHVIPQQGMPYLDDEGAWHCGDLKVSFQISMPPQAAEHVRSQSSACPTSWFDVPVVCSSCQEKFVLADNAADTCWVHAGQLVSEISSDGKQRIACWSCCKCGPGSPGCSCRGAHTPLDDSVAKAKNIASLNALETVVAYGDPYQVGGRLLWCQDADLARATALAIEHSNFFAFVVLTRAGGQAPLESNFQSSMKACISCDVHYGSYLEHVLSSDEELLDILLRVPGAIVTLFQQCCRDGKLDLVLLMLRHERVGLARCRWADDEFLAATVFVHAARQRHYDCMRQLVGLGMSPNMRTTLGQLPLLQSVESGHDDVTAFLIEQGADPNLLAHSTVLNRVTSCLATAASMGKHPLVALLIKSKADVNVVDTLGRTALHEACLTNQHLVAQLLVAAGAATCPRDAGGQRPIDLAEAKNLRLVIAALQPSIIQEALQSMAGLTMIRILNDQLEKPQANLHERSSLKDVSSSILVLEDALRTLCMYSKGLAPACRADLCGTITGIPHALRAFFLWRNAQDQPSKMRTTGINAISALISAGVGVKTRLQQLEAEMEALQAV